MPSRQHEQAKTNLFDHLQRKLSTCSWCAMGLRESHPRFHDSSAAREPEQLVAWTCRSMHGHVLDMLAGTPYAPYAPAIELRVVRVARYSATPCRPWAPRRIGDRRL